MGRELTIYCPHCNSDKLVRNGHPHGAKHEFFCKSCNRYFTEDSLKGYPPSNIPFPVIAYFLYFRRKVPGFSDMRKFRKFVNHWLFYLDVYDKEVSRQTAHHWISNYSHFLDRVITFQESRDFVKDLLVKKDKLKPAVVRVSYTESLKILEEKFGRAYVVDLIRSDPGFLKEFCNVISRHLVYSWEDKVGRRRGRRSPSSG